MSDAALVGSSPPGPDDAACLPACFEFPPKALVLTVESPIDGMTRTAYDIDIPDDPNLRLLFRHPTDPCPFRDITESVQSLAFDPRLKDSATWSRVQFVAGRLIPGCTPLVAADVDMDGYPAGGATPPASADCDDANPGINPAAAELCNGMDDDCDGTVDETGCGTIGIRAFLHKVGSGSSPTSSTGPLVGAEVRLYDTGAGTCADSIGNSPKNYSTIYGEGTFADPGCAATTSGLTDSEGMISFAAAPGDYIAIGRPAPPHRGVGLRHRGVPDRDAERFPLVHQHHDRSAAGLRRRRHHPLGDGGRWDRRHPVHALRHRHRVHPGRAPPRCLARRRQAQLHDTRRVAQGRRRGG
ncbi:MAG: putative metal-binding motif-containing protein [Acidobacteria bacterium]|nr:putative metal-binding motif-containing protein [Acidobacteriota bacterium]